MDNYSNFIVAHIVALIVTAVAVVIRAKPMFVTSTGGAATGDTAGFSTPKALVALQHSGMTLTVLTGIVLLYINQFRIENWFYAKIILFFVILSALAKAFKKGNSVSTIQRKAGLIIALIASLAIIVLVFTAPNFH